MSCLTQVTKLKNLFTRVFDFYCCSALRAAKHFLNGLFKAAAVQRNSRRDDDDDVDMGDDVDIGNDVDDDNDNDVDDDEDADDDDEGALQLRDLQAATPPAIKIARARLPFERRVRRRL